MIMSVIKYLMSFVIGISIGFFVFSNQNAVQPSEEEITSTIEREYSPPVFKEIPVTDVTASKEDISDVVDSKDRIIDRLKKRIESLELKLSSIAENNPEELQTEPKLTKLSMKELRKRMNNDFKDKFKGMVVESSERELSNMKRAFESDQTENQWSKQYTENINDFLDNGDIASEHFIQNIECKSHMCKLEISSNNDESWGKLYSSMTEQDWYQSITFMEKSEYPGFYVYYLPRVGETKEDEPVSQ